MLDALTIERAQALSNGAPLLAAVSGGGDSAALLHLLVERLGPLNLATLTVDHGLRQGADLDARRACAMAGDLGVKRRAMVALAWPAASQPGQQAARRARYVALCAYARRLGARVIGLGHTRDDQAETVLLRAARGSGWRGLAGMRALAPAPLWPEGRGLWLARPLLGVGRAALRDLLRQRSAGWLEDPANANAAFARVRARARLAELERAGFDPAALAALAERLQPVAAALDASAAALIAQAVSFNADRISVRRAPWMEAAGAVRQRALSALIAAASGAAQEPPAEQVEAIEAQIAAPGFAGATLAGAWVCPSPDGFRLCRDPGALRGRADGASPPPPLALETGVEAVWDGRLALIAPEPGWSVVVGEAGPVLARGEARRPLSEAAARWLLEARVRHALAHGQ